MSKLEDEMIVQEIEDDSKWMGEAEWRELHSHIKKEEDE